MYFLIMGSLNENRGLRQIAGGAVYPMVILLTILFTLEIISPSFKLRNSNALDLSHTTRSHDDAPKARVYAPAGRPGNEDARELMFESLTLLRDVMVDIKSGSTKKFSFKSPSTD